MGVFTEKCYGVQCDGCKKVHEDMCTGFAIFNDMGDATDSADKDDWKQINGKWYCPECVEKLFHYDEELDEYVPNNVE